MKKILIIPGFVVISVIILIILFNVFPFFSYDRVDIIGKDDFRFKVNNYLHGDLVGQAYVYSDDPLLDIVVRTEEVLMRCSDRSLVVINVKNNAVDIVRPEFRVTHADGLRFTIPDVVVPAHSEREVTLFIDADCVDKDRVIIPRISVVGTDIMFDLSVLVENKLE